MFQREVAERIVATPGSKTYGRLSVLVQWRCEARIMFDVNASAFVPPPKVTSSIVRHRAARWRRCPCDRELLERVTQAAFGQRRKMLRQSLRSLGADAAALLEAAELRSDGASRGHSRRWICGVGAGSRRGLALKA